MSEQQSKQKVRRSWNRLFLNQQWLVRNLPFFLFLALLTVLYIYNGHYAEKMIKDINRTAAQVKELQYEYKTLKSEWMFLHKQSEVVRAVESIGLKEMTQPPFRLKDTLIAQ